MKSVVVLTIYQNGSCLSLFGPKKAALQKALPLKAPELDKRQGRLLEEVW